MDTSDTIPEFGIKRENEERRDGGCGIVFDPQMQKYAVGRQGEAEHETGLLRLFSGGVDTSEDIQDGVLREVRQEGGLHDFLYVEKIGEAMAHYHNSLRNVNRVAKATCFLVILKGTDLVPVQLEEHEKFTLAWVTADEMRENWQMHGRGADHWIYFLEKAVARAAALGYDTTSLVV